VLECAAYSHAAAKADDAEPICVAALCLGPGDRAVEIGQQFRVRLGVDDRQQLRDVGDLGEVDALAEIVVRGDGECAELGETTHDVLDVFVQAEDLHRNQNDRRIGDALGPGEVAGHIAIGDLDLDVAGIEAVGRGRDHVGPDWPGGKRIARRHGGRSSHEATPGKWRSLGQSDDVGRQLGTNVHADSSGNGWTGG
jgi:hypothetical protein